MAKKKGVAAKLPRHDRSRALPVRTGWGLWKTIAVAAVIGAAVYIVHGPDKDVSIPAPPTIVEPR